MQESQRPEVVGTFTVRMLDTWLDHMSNPQYEEQCRLQRQVRFALDRERVL